MAHALIAEAAEMGLLWGRSDGVPVPRSALVAEARSWLRTPFQHQGELKGVGVDCAGLIRGVSLALGLIPADYRRLMPSLLSGYSRQPSGDLGEQLCDHYWQRIDFADAEAGDVVVCQWRGGPPQHIAVLGDGSNGMNLIHALRGRGVVEHGIDAQWRARIAAAYKIPGVA